jgi:tetraacyldisaccharide 4'-kinase
MREPAFWFGRPSLPSRLLSPVAAIYGAIAGRRMTTAGRRAAVPVICIGNYHVGGAGKTPATIALAAMLRKLGERPAVVSRGYGGRLQGPVPVDATSHKAFDVGDEPLMMAAKVPVIIARDRVAGAAMAAASGATVILLDDGFQNPALLKDISLIVMDSHRGIGNGCVFPSGPLRAPLAAQIARTDALILVGAGTATDNIEMEILKRRRPVFRSCILPDEKSVKALRGQRVLAFAGIGDPARFFATLGQEGIEVIETRAFADHHAFRKNELKSLQDKARAQSLTLVTTEKDMARIASDTALAGFAPSITAFPIVLEISDRTALTALLAERLAAARGQRALPLNASG